MKPQGDVLRKRDWFINEIDQNAAKGFVEEFHYSKGCSLTSVHRHGLFHVAEPKVLKGVALWLPPTRVAAESVNKQHWTRVLSLSRLAVHPSCPANAATFLMAGSIRRIKREGKWVSLVTYADTFRGHTGTIYRAANWEYVGRRNGSPRWENNQGKQVAVKSTRTRTKAEMAELGYVNVGTFDKHKFVMHLKTEECYDLINN